MDDEEFGKEIDENDKRFDSIFLIACILASVALILTMIFDPRFLSGLLHEQQEESVSALGSDYSPQNLLAVSLTPTSVFFAEDTDNGKERRRANLDF
jgi:hypothetical protein